MALPASSKGKRQHPTRTSYLHLVLVLSLLMSALGASAQGPPIKYKRGYFMFPFVPGMGRPVQLTGNMGEIRSNHFHGGLDVRTNYLTGQPLYAAADGYISYIQQSTNGYGNMCMIKHPNGLTTVYAHIESFVAPVQEYLRSEQYKQETFEIELRPQANQFPVKKGDLIALSGNTGHSGGPHLHFEIRDSLEGIYNPLVVGFDEVWDKLSPYFVRLAVRPLNEKARVEGTLDRKEYEVAKKGSIYGLAKPIVANGLIGIEGIFHDRISNGSQRAGVNCIEIKVDGQQVYYYTQDHLPLAQAKQINHHIAYDALVKTGYKFQKCYLDDGNLLKKFRTPEKYGFIQVNAGDKKELEIILTDEFGHHATLQATIKGETLPVLATTTKTTPGKPRLKYEIVGNFLKMKVNHLPLGYAKLPLYINGKTEEVAIAYEQEADAIFLHDLRTGIPDSALLPNSIEPIYLKGVIYPNKAGKVSLPLAEINYTEAAVFDTVYLPYREALDKKYIQIGDPTVAIQQAIQIDLKIPDTVKEDEKLGVVQVLDNEGKMRWVGGRKTEAGSYRFKARYFGRYWFAKDNKAPVAKLITANNRGILIRIGDDLSGIQSWRATLNGQWLLMSYEHKTSLLKAEPRKKGDSLKGTLSFELTDRAGNKSTFTREVL